jgi:hypothetical protein
MVPSSREKCVVNRWFLRDHALVAVARTKESIVVAESYKYITVTHES